MMRDVTEYSFDQAFEQATRKPVLPSQKHITQQQPETVSPPVHDEGRLAPTAKTPAPIKPPSPRITLRLTEEENTLLRDMAGGMTISAYIRECVFGENTKRRKRKSYVPIKDHVALAQLLGMLGEAHLANNLNQLAYHANCGNLDVTERTIAQLDEMYTHVTSMRDTLIRTLGLLEDA